MRAALKDLITSEGWKILKAKISERRASAVSTLISLRNPDEISRVQEMIKAYDFLMLLPNQILATMEAKDKNG